MSVNCSVMSNSLQPHRLQPTRLLCPWDSPGKNMGIGSHSLLCGIFPIQGSNLGLLHWQADSLLSELARKTPPTHTLSISQMSIVFPVVMYGCESWTIKKAEHQRFDAFGLWCWRRLLRVSWTVRRSNQSILKEINPEYSLEGMMLKLKLRYFGRMM